MYSCRRSYAALAVILLSPQINRLLICKLGFLHVSECLILAILFITVQSAICWFIVGITCKTCCWLLAGRALAQDSAGCACPCWQSHSEESFMLPPLIYSRCQYHRVPHSRMIRSSIVSDLNHGNSLLCIGCRQHHRASTSCRMRLLHVWQNLHAYPMNQPLIQTGAKR